MEIENNLQVKKIEVLNISFVNGIFVPNDAISNIMRDKIAALSNYCELNNIPHKIKIFVQYGDVDDSRLKTINSFKDLLKDDHFKSSDLIFYEYGIYYDLFNSIAFAHTNAEIIVQYYGITPAMFLPEKEKKIIEQSYEQLKLILLSDKIIIYSKNTEKDLRDIGVSDKKFLFSTVPVCLASPPNDESIQNKKSKGVRLLYVGRFVRSKGVIDLLQAVEKLIKSGFKDFKLKLIGSLNFSDSQYVEDIKRFIALKKIFNYVTFIGTVNDEELCRYYVDSDALIIPSFHEGFCVPVIEAYTHGCFVIAYNSGNLPSVLNGYGRIIEAGDIQQLYLAIRDYCKTRMSNKNGIQEEKFKTDIGDMFEKELITKIKEYASHFTIDSYGKNISVIFENILKKKKEKTDISKRKLQANNGSAINDSLVNFIRNNEKNFNNTSDLKSKKNVIVIKSKIFQLFSDIL